MRNKKMKKTMEEEIGELSVGMMPLKKEEYISLLKQLGLESVCQNQTDEQIECFLERVSEKIKLCLLCNGKPYTRSIFMPEDSSNWGAKKGEQKFFFYSLCRKCLEMDAVGEKVEKRILESL